MPTVTVTRLIEPDGNYFKVECNGNRKFFAFKIDEPSDSLYNEERNKQEAISLAKIWENTGGFSTSEVIYQTGENDIPEDLFISPLANASLKAITKSNHYS